MLVTANPFIGDSVVPGRRCGRVIAAEGNKYRLVDDQGRIFRAEGAQLTGRYYRPGQRLIVLSGVVMGEDEKPAA